MFQLTGGMHDYRTIQFMIRDRAPAIINSKEP